MTNIRRTGECFCGAVKYKIEGPVFGARSCHCSRCRKAFSAQASSYALIEPGSLTWTQGEEELATFPAEGPIAKKFCKTCASTLCGVMDGEIHGIALGCLNDDAGIEIEAHIFAGSKACWEVLPEGVPIYDTFPPEWVKEPGDT